MRQRRAIHRISSCAVVTTRDQNARRRDADIIVRIRGIWRFSNPRLFPDILRCRYRVGLRFSFTQTPVGRALVIRFHGKVYHLRAR